MFTLYKNAELYAPEAMGKKDVLLWNSKVFDIGENLSIPQGYEGETVDASGKIMMPGIVDTHVHITGGGGEGGFTTRMSELTFDEAVEAGVTALVGVLGTDGYGRRPEDVLIKCMQLNELGFDCYMLTGSYTLPVVNILGEVAKDVIFFEKIIGAGEVALNDHRGSCMTYEELLRITCDVRNGARLAGKKGTVNIHLGNYLGAFKTLLDIATTDISLLSVMVPTHINRTKDVFAESLEWIDFGGYADITGGSMGAAAWSGAEAMEMLYERKGNLEKITMTSDGCGSMPSFDKFGNLIGMAKGTSSVLLEELRTVMKNGKIPFETAILPITKNGADAFGFKTGAGTITVGGVANILLLDGEGYLQTTILNGKEVYNAK
jgi:isoaspartyl dipeptidase IadA